MSAITNLTSDPTNWSALLGTANSNWTCFTLAKIIFLIFYIILIYYIKNKFKIIIKIILIYLQIKNTLKNNYYCDTKQANPTS
jgi:hypothetical protein